MTTPFNHQDLAIAARLSALPCDLANFGPQSPLSAEVDSILAFEKALAGEAVHLSEAIYNAVNRMEDKRMRGSLLAARRRIHNKKTVPAAEHAALLAALQPAEVAQVEAYCSKLALIEDASMSFVRRHDQLLGRAREAFQQNILDQGFQLGLALSSQTLFANVRRYRTATASHIGSRDEQIERGLLRYFTRATRKATPFSRFCNVVAANFFSSSDAKRISITGNSDSQLSALTLNKKLLAVLWPVLESSPEVRESLIVETNPTTTRTENEWRFLTSSADREVFRTLQRKPSIDTIWATVHDYPIQTVAQLIDRLTESSSIDATKDEVTAFIEALVKIGFLRLRTPIGEFAHRWAEELAEFLRPFEAKAVEDVRQLLEELVGATRLIHEADPPRRAAIVQDMKRRVNSAVASLGLNSAMQHELPIFEDCTIAAAVNVPLAESMKGALQTFRDYLEVTARLAFPRSEQLTMRHFFDKTYGRSDVPLLAFYEGYYRGHQKEHRAQESRPRQANADANATYDIGNPFGIASIDAIRAARKTISSLFRNQWLANPQADEISVSLTDIEEAVRLTPPMSRVSRSNSAFCQLQPETMETSARVICSGGQYYAGYGKYFSRFLHLLPDRITDELRADNLRADGSHILAEISGDAHHNANLHPQLLPWELAYPVATSDARSPVISCVDIVVRPDPNDEGALVLVHAPSGRRVLPIDLGFLSILRRPPLYRLLANFMPPSIFSLMLPETANETLGDTAHSVRDGSAQVEYRPRFVIGDDLVVARRRWRLRGTDFPQQQAAESNAAYYRRLHTWRQQWRIPDAVYVRLWPVWQRTSSQNHDGTPNGPGPQDADRTNADQEMVDSAPGPDGGVPVEEQQVERPPEEVLETVDNKTKKVESIDERMPSRYSRDFRKPQYLNLLDPLLVRLCARIAGPLKEYVVTIEEVYPTDSALPKTASGQTFAAEYVVQFFCGVLGSAGSCVSGDAIDNQAPVELSVDRLVTPAALATHG